MSVKYAESVTHHDYCSFLTKPRYKSALLTAYINNYINKAATKLYLLGTADGNIVRAIAVNG